MSVSVEKSPVVRSEGEVKLYRTRGSNHFVNNRNVKVLSDKTWISDSFFLAPISPLKLFSRAGERAATCSQSKSCRCIPEATCTAAVHCSSALQLCTVAVRCCIPSGVCFYRCLFKIIPAADKFLASFQAS